MESQASALPRIAKSRATQLRAFPDQADLPRTKARVRVPKLALDQLSNASALVQNQDVNLAPKDLPNLQMQQNATTSLMDCAKSLFSGAQEQCPSVLTQTKRVENEFGRRRTYAEDDSGKFIRKDQRPPSPNVLAKTSGVQADSTNFVSNAAEQSDQRMQKVIDTFQRDGTALLRERGHMTEDVTLQTLSPRAESKKKVDVNAFIQEFYSKKREMSESAEREATAKAAARQQDELFSTKCSDLERPNEGRQCTADDSIYSGSISESISDLDHQYMPGEDEVRISDGYQSHYTTSRGDVYQPTGDLESDIAMRDSSSER